MQTEVSHQNHRRREGLSQRRSSRRPGVALSPAATFTLSACPPSSHLQKLPVCPARTRQSSFRRSCSPGPSSPPLSTVREMEHRRAFEAGHLLRPGLEAELTREEKLRSLLTNKTEAQLTTADFAMFDTLLRAPSPGLDDDLDLSLSGAERVAEALLSRPSSRLARPDSPVKLQTGRLWKVERQLRWIETQLRATTVPPHILRACAAAGTELDEPCAAGEEGAPAADQQAPCLPSHPRPHPLLSPIPPVLRTPKGSLSERSVSSPTPVLSPDSKPHARTASANSVMSMWTA